MPGIENIGGGCGFKKGVSQANFALLCNPSSSYYTAVVGIIEAFLAQTAQFTTFLT